MFTPSDDINRALRTAAHCPTLMLASDFDGCLAPLNKDAMAVTANPTAMNAVIDLAHMPHTFGALVSGRDISKLERLARRTGPQGQYIADDGPDDVRDISGIILAGSHGAEANDGSGVEPNEEQKKLLERMIREAHAVADSAPHSGMFVEEKPLGVGLHGVAMNNDELERQLQQKFANILDSLLNGTTGSYMYGKHILEAQIMEVDKGKWLESARDRYNVDAIVYAGDDTTDENAFRVLHGNDVSIKVGDSHTAAVLRVPDTDAIADVYQRLATMRREYLTENRVL